MLDVPNDMLEQYEQNGQRYPKNICTQGGSAEACDNLIYSSLMGLVRCGLLPRYRPEDFKYSYKYLRDNIGMIEVKTCPTENISISDSPIDTIVNHETCKGESLSAKVQKVMDSMPTPVLECHRVHMRAQQKKL